MCWCWHTWKLAIYTVYFYAAWSSVGKNVGETWHYCLLVMNLISGFLPLSSNTDESFFYSSTVKWYHKAKYIIMPVSQLMYDAQPRPKSHGHTDRTVHHKLPLTGGQLQISSSTVWNRSWEMGHEIDWMQSLRAEEIGYFPVSVQSLM